MKILLTIVVISLLTISCSGSVSNMTKNKFLSQYSIYTIKEKAFVRNSSVDNSAEYQPLLPLRKVTNNFEKKVKTCLISSNKNNIIKEDGHYYIITRALSSDLGDLEMSLDSLGLSAITNLSYFNAKLLISFSDFVLKNNKEIKNIEKIKEISSINGSSATSMFSSKNPRTLGFFQKNDKEETQYICNIYNIEVPIYKKLKRTNKKLSEEDVNKLINKFVIEMKYKIIY